METCFTILGKYINKEETRYKEIRMHNMSFFMVPIFFLRFYFNVLNNACYFWLLLPHILALRLVVNTFRSSFFLTKKTQLPLKISPYRYYTLLQSMYKSVLVFVKWQIKGYFFWDQLRIFYTNLHELFCQFISWTNWVNLWTIAEYHVKLWLIWKNFMTIS